MLTGRTKGLIGRALNKFLTETCQIEGETLARGQFGERTHGFDVVGADVPCRVIRAGASPSQTTSGEIGSQETIVERYRLIVPAGTVLNVDQRVTVGGAVYQIVDVVTAWADAVDAQAVMVRAR